MQSGGNTIPQIKTLIADRSKIAPRTLLFGLISLTAALVLGILALHDYEWTFWLHQHRIEWLDGFMAHSLFEGKGFGGGDPVTFFLIADALLYFYAWLGPGNRWLERRRPAIGFILTAGFTCSFLMVQSLKFVLGRARPVAVLINPNAYSEWYQFGKHFVIQGINEGSFPSGHTALVLSLMTVSYILLASPESSVRRRRAGLAWGFVSIGYGLLMALARTMALGHWLADCMFSLLVGWAILHVLYFRVLRVPAQTSYYLRHGTYPDTPKMWELRLCGLLFLSTSGGAAVIIGLRSIWEHSFHWLAALVPPGIILLLFFVRRLGAFRKRIFENYPFTGQSIQCHGDRVHPEGPRLPHSDLPLIHP